MGVVVAVEKWGARSRRAEECCDDRTADEKRIEGFRLEEESMNLYKQKATGRSD